MVIDGIATSYSNENEETATSSRFPIGQRNMLSSNASKFSGQCFECMMDTSLDLNREGPIMRHRPSWKDDWDDDGFLVGGLLQSVPIAAEDSCSFFIRNLPPDCRVNTLLGSFRRYGFGRIFSTHINRPNGNHRTSAAKLVLFDVSASRAFYGHSRAPLSWSAAMRQPSCGIECLWQNLSTLLGAAHRPDLERISNIFLESLAPSPRSLLTITSSSTAAMSFDPPDPPGRSNRSRPIWKDDWEDEDFIMFFNDQENQNSN
ncbi:hypothetical protein QBC34DRAFT_466207 [Podospora aff. communis PSN243]|uniref:RRM domain-containing protein n=1 Tax=Podospora aff. communis PSN243 TaxID=3040156 RepID=A0AAV9GL23_9PEZI|nr:hypothetical protein QBC34DRAFT_466207 [Podospora aff. communis PSN243]